MAEETVEKPLSLLAPVVTDHLTHHVFVCTGKSCRGNQSEATLQAFYEVLREKNLLYGKRGSLDGSVVVTQCGSVGLCAVGPAVLIYPDGTWYYGVTPEDVSEIVDTHILNHRRVERLYARTVGE